MLYQLSYLAPPREARANDAVAFQQNEQNIEYITAASYAGCVDARLSKEPEWFTSCLSSFS